MSQSYFYLAKADYFKVFIDTLNTWGWVYNKILEINPRLFQYEQWCGETEFQH